MSLLEACSISVPRCLRMKTLQELTCNWGQCTLPWLCLSWQLCLQGVVGPGYGSSWTPFVTGKERLQYQSLVDCIFQLLDNDDTVFFFLSKILREFLSLFYITWHIHLWMEMQNTLRVTRVQCVTRTEQMCFRVIIMACRLIAQI